MGAHKDVLFWQIHHGDPDNQLMHPCSGVVWHTPQHFCKSDPGPYLLKQGSCYPQCSSSCARQRFSSSAPCGRTDIDCPRVVAMPDVCGTQEMAGISSCRVLLFALPAAQLPDSQHSNTLGRRLGCACIIMCSPGQSRLPSLKESWPSFTSGS